MKPNLCIYHANCADGFVASREKAATFEPDFDMGRNT